MWNEETHYMISYVQSNGDTYCWMSYLKGNKRYEAHKGWSRIGRAHQSGGPGGFLIGDAWEDTWRKGGIELDTCRKGVSNRTAWTPLRPEGSEQGKGQRKNWKVIVQESGGPWKLFAFTMGKMGALGGYRGACLQFQHPGVWCRRIATSSGPAWAM